MALVTCLRLLTTGLTHPSPKRVCLFLLIPRLVGFFWFPLHATRYPRKTNHTQEEQTFSSVRLSCGDPKPGCCRRRLNSVQPSGPFGTSNFAKRAFPLRSPNSCGSPVSGHNGVYIPIPADGGVVGKQTIHSLAIVSLWVEEVPQRLYRFGRRKAQNEMKTFVLSVPELLKEGELREGNFSACQELI